MYKTDNEWWTTFRRILHALLLSVMPVPVDFVGVLKAYLNNLDANIT